MHRGFIIAMVFAATLRLSACGAGPSGPQVSVEDAWARSVPAAGGNGAVFMRLVNGGDEADHL